MSIFCISVVNSDQFCKFPFKHKLVNLDLGVFNTPGFHGWNEAQSERV